MQKIRVTKEFRFEAAHALKGYDGLCRHVHGHSYTLRVTVLGTPSGDPGSPKLGMVIDFGDLKRLVRKAVIDPLDHALLLHQDMNEERISTEEDPFRNVIFLPYQPTSENLLIDFARRIRELLPTGVTLHSLRLRETSNSYAEWFAAENE